MKVDFIPGTETKPAAADLNGLDENHWISMIRKIGVHVMEALFPKKQAPPPEPDEDSE